MTCSTKDFSTTNSRIVFIALVHVEDLFTAQRDAFLLSPVFPVVCALDTSVKLTALRWRRYYLLQSNDTASH